jgi:hypothetical protein
MFGVMPFDFLSFLVIVKFRLLQKGDNNISQFSKIEETPSLTQLIQEIDTIQAKINAQKPLQEAIWATIQEKLRI